MNGITWGFASQVRAGKWVGVQLKHELVIFEAGNGWMGFITSVSLLLYIFEVFHSKSVVKSQPITHYNSILFLSILKLLCSEHYIHFLLTVYLSLKYKLFICESKCLVFTALIPKLRTVPGILINISD